MKRNCNSEDFCLDSLFQLAETTKKSHIEEISTFDVMMRDGIHTDGERHILVEHYHLFCALFTVPCTDQMTDALHKIRDKLMVESQNQTVWFEVPDVN